MSTGMSSAAHESHYGPPSELIDVGEFVRSAQDPRSHSTTPSDAFSLQLNDSRGEDELPEVLTEEQRTALKAECSLDDIKSTIEDVLRDPRLYVHARQVHDTSVHSIYDLADKNAPSKRKRKREVVSSASEDAPALSAFKKVLNDITLKSWPLPQDAALYMRGPKTSDINALAELKKTTDISEAEPQSAIITVTVLNRISWSHNFVSRSSQHAVLSQHTLGDLFDVIPCPSNEAPRELLEDGKLVGYEADAENAPLPSGYVVVVEGVAYGDGLKEVDYADKLISYMSSPPKRGTKMHETTFSSLSLRLNQPYWLLHEGNCEHFLVVDEIRLLHPDDPQSGYPLTLQITPPLLDTCKACAKVPAVYSIVGDVRLGESPCLLCAPCWRIMGEPKGPDAGGVIIIPLPSHEFGW